AFVESERRRDSLRPRAAGDRIEARGSGETPPAATGMSEESSEADLYARAGIEDVAEFYREKFVSNAVLDHRYFKALDRFDLRFGRTMWVYDNVRRNSAVLDVGC